MENSTHKSLSFGLTFTNDFHPFPLVPWERRTVGIEGSSFHEDNQEFPAFWSQRASNIVASKYFRVVNGERETSVQQMITRVAGTITRWGHEDGYFATKDDRNTFYCELCFILVHQFAAFNSPVWFNVGVVEQAQTSACFTLDVEDSMVSILDWITTEGMIFKGGSGAGVNVSKIRPKDASLSSGGKASGPLSFMQVADANAGAIKSGGSTRRAAKMVIMDVEHQDIYDFIWCKAEAEKMAGRLRAVGMKDAIEGGIQDMIPYQNANNSVGVPDNFMQDVADRYRGTEYGKGANETFEHIARAAWECGDPGLFFRDTVNAWHTTPGAGSIVSSNPCGEFLRPPNEACNLASLNLLKFLCDDGTFDIPAFEHTVDVMITAMDILIDHSSYPTEDIATNARKYRPLGLGYANLGALLMAKGLPYDSGQARDYAACITALMTGRAYFQSSKLAEYTNSALSRHHMGEVIQKHRSHLALLGATPAYDDSDAIFHAAEANWMLCADHDIRNCQVSVIAPTGTISFMMDCDTTGIEPCTGLVVKKKLVGGGEMTMVSDSVVRGLQALQYPEDRITHAMAHMRETGTMNGYVSPEHRAVFATALGESPISWQGHVKMVAAVQPFVSGGISKTINMPHNSTVQDVMDAYVMAWKLGCKTISIYRDGCKGVQPLEVVGATGVVGETREKSVDNPLPAPVLSPRRRRLPAERPSVTHKFSIANHEGYLTLSFYPDTNQPGELFINMAKEGSTVRGLLDTIGILTSLALQYGVPVKALTEKLSGSRFEPAGFTDNPQIRIAKSPVDYIFRWLESKCHEDEMVEEPAIVLGDDYRIYMDAPTCAECGSLMSQRSGSCYTCDTCGSSSGCS